MEKIRFDRSLIWWLLIGAVLMLFSNGRWLFPPAAWIAPVAWLVFLERTPPVRGLVLIFLAYFVVTSLQWRGLIPAPGWIYYAIALVYAIFYFLPFLVHRLLAVRLTGILATLVFPAAWVAVEFVFHRWITPYGSWFSLAYTQADFDALLQLAALTGIAGVSFVIVWFSGIVAVRLRPAGPAPEKPWFSAWVFGGMLLLILLYGNVRQASSATDARPIRTASIVPNADLLGELEDALTPARRGEAFSSEELTRLVDAAGVLNEDLIARTRREAEAGARLVAWAETAGRVLKVDEDELLGELQRLAFEQNVVLVVGYGVFDPSANPPLENKVAAIDGSGRLAWEYEKAHPIVGAESGFIRAGDGIIRALETDFGRVGAVICHDLDFPELLLDAARLNLDLVIGPSADWEDITPLHADMAKLRAIEGGYWLLRPTSGGRSLAADRTGRELAISDFPRDAMVTDMAPRFGWTLYGRLGDWFAWVCVLGLVAMIGNGFRSTSRSQSSLE